MLAAKKQHLSLIFGFLEHKIAKNVDKGCEHSVKELFLVGVAPHAPHCINVDFVLFTVRPVGNGM